MPIRHCVACGKKERLVGKIRSNKCFKCSHAGYQKEEDRTWTKDKNGYLTCRIKNKLIYQHRYIMEKKLERPLEKGEIVHHKNGIRHDNNISNLEIIYSQSNHMKEHLKKAGAKEFYKEMSKKGHEARWGYKYESNL